MDNTEETLKIISESFLNSGDKQLLIEELEKDGPSELFFAFMNKLLIAELEKKSSAYERIMDDFQMQQNSAEVAYKQKRQELDIALDKALSEIDPADLMLKEKIFEKYYKDIDSEQIIYEKNVKEIYSKLFITGMN